MKTIIITILILTCLILPASAYTISGMNISPQENIVAGDKISMSFSIKPTPSYYPDGRRYSANPENTIAIVTALDNPVWIRETVLNGASSLQTIEGNNVLALEGWDIAYLQSSVIPVGYDELIKITLSGNAPNVSSTSAVPFITVSEHDQKGQKIQGSEQVFRQTVINRNDLVSALYLAEQDIKKFDASIAEKEAMGIDVSVERKFHTSAVTILDITKKLPPDQYQDALVRLKNINTLVYEGETALNRAWAAQEIEKAYVPLNQLDNVIEWFDDNSTLDYPGLNHIIAQQGNASRAINAATKTMQAGEFDESRDLSREAFLIANQTYNDALIVQKRAMDPLTIVWDFWYVPVIGVIAGAVYLLFKPRKKKPKKPKEKKE